MNKKKYIIGSTDVKKYAKTYKDYMRSVDDKSYYKSCVDKYSESPIHKRNYEKAVEKCVDCEAKWKEACREFDEIIEQFQKRARVRYLTLEVFLSAMEKLQERMDLVSTKKDAVGTYAFIDPFAQKFPNAYKGIPESTHFDVKLLQDGWALTQVYRSSCETHSAAIDIHFTEATEMNLAKRLCKIGV